MRGESQSANSIFLIPEHIGFGRGQKTAPVVLSLTPDFPAAAKPPESSQRL